MIPDGDFPTVERPNPQYPEVFRLGIDIAQKEQADLIIATDPDADRVGIAVLDEKGEARLMSGNETGVLVENFLFNVLKERKYSSDL